MKVRSGWNSEYARKKYDVELDETDLARILQAADIPLEVQPKLNAAQAHALLYLSAEIMARQTLVRFDPSLKEDLQKEIAQLAGEKNAALAVIRKKHGLSEEDRDGAG